MIARPRKKHGTPRERYFRQCITDTPFSSILSCLSFHGESKMIIIVLYFKFVMKKKYFERI